MRGAHIALGLSILFVLSCDGSRSSPVPQQTTVAPTPPRQPFEPRTATLAQQKMCDEQAGKKFVEYTAQKDRDRSSYMSHYDPAVNVCYVRIETSSVVKGSAFYIADVYDAFEGRTFASYAGGKPPPLLCEVDLPGKDTLRCASFDEFNQLTETYFGMTR